MMLKSEAIFSGSIIGGMIPRLIDPDIRKMSDTVYVDVVPSLVGCTRFVAYEYNDSIVVDDDYGEELVPTYATAVRNELEKIAELRDSIAVVGFVTPDLDVICADLYQFRDPEGWLSATFCPAYFEWVLSVRTLERRACFKYGIDLISLPILVDRWCKRKPGETLIFRTNGKLCAVDRAAYVYGDEHDDRIRARE